MRIVKEDPILDALIDLFNEQASKHDWDAAYGTSVAIAEHYQDRADSIRSSVVGQLKLGVVNRAKQSAEAAVLKGARPRRKK